MTVKRNPNVSNWSPDDGYNIEFQKNEYPTRIFNSKQGLAFHTTLMVHLNASEFLCAAYLEGFKVTLTTPGDARKSSTRYFNALVSEQMDIFIKPKLVTTSSTLRKYLPIQRQCFFSDERQLHYFKIYTQNNCELECLSNFTKFDCGCVKFSSPREFKTIYSLHIKQMNVFFFENVFQQEIETRKSVETVIFNVIAMPKRNYTGKTLWMTLTMIRWKYFVMNVIAFHRAHPSSTMQTLIELNSTICAYWNHWDNQRALYQGMENYLSDGLLLI